MSFISWRTGVPSVIIRGTKSITLKTSPLGFSQIFSAANNKFACLLNFSLVPGFLSEELDILKYRDATCIGLIECSDSAHHLFALSY